jgi:hypothetical protein
MSNGANEEKSQNRVRVTPMVVRVLRTGKRYAMYRTRRLYAAKDTPSGDCGNLMVMRSNGFAAGQYGLSAQRRVVIRDGY